MTAEPDKTEQRLLTVPCKAIDLGEKDGAARGSREKRRGVAQLAVGLRGAEHKEGRVREGGEIVEGLRDGLRACAGLAGNEGDTEVRGKQANLRPEAHHGGAGAEEALRAVAKLGGGAAIGGRSGGEGENARHRSHTLAVSARDLKA